MTPAGPTRHELVEADRRARWQAISELRRPLLLEAGAGTGKTTTLVARILAWCLGHGWDRAAAGLAARGAEAGDEEVAARVLEGVVAITFTEAAAAEMASRTGRDLALVAAGREDELHGLQAAALPRPLLAEERRARARALLGALDHLQVRTIHAFCLTLLAQHPLEARLHTDLRVDPEGRLVEELTREVLEPRLEALAAGRDDGDAVLALARRGIGPRELAGAVADLLSHGLTAGALAHDPLAPEALAELAWGLRARLEELLLRAGPLRRLAGQTKPAAVLRAADDTLRALAAWRGDGPAALARLRDELAARWTGDLDGRLRSWARADFNQGERRALGEQRGLLAEAAARLRTPLRHTARLDPELLDVGRRLLQPLAVAVEREMRSRGIITFPALLREAQQLVARHPAVCRSLRRRIDQLLVDEFQDTDRLQCEIVRRLALEGPAAERPGLFVVGDPKQSIFGWRDADLEAYQGFAAELLAAGGERHVLSVNYRSRQVILEEVERAVAPVMVARPGLQPPFAPLVAGRATAAGAQAGSPAAGGAADPAPAVEYWVSWQAGPAEPQGGAATPAEEAVRLEARAVATDMRALHQEHSCPWREMALLLRSMSRLEVFLGALRDAGVPFVVTKDKHYYRRREIIEAAALVRAVVDPLDHLALLTWLRSAAVGVPDAALVPLWQGGFPRLASDLRVGGAALDQLAELAAGVAAELPAGLPGLAELAGWHEVLVAALDALARLRESFRSDPADVFVERLRRLSQLEVVESSRYLGRFRLANLERFFRQLESAIDERGADVSAVLGVLRQRVAQAEEAEEALPKEAAENAVQVLTIHRAKGLEFDHVYLAQLHAQPGARGAGSLDPDERWLPDAPAQYAIFGAATPGFAEVEARRREVAAAEQVRTLYVAMTRARRRLVLAGCWPAATRPRDPAQARCHIDLLLSRRPAAPDLAKMWREAAHGAGWVDALAARWRFPALEHPTAAAAAEPPPASWVPSAERVAADARRLAELEGEAAQRMARRWIAPASEEAAAKLRELALVPGSGLPAARDAALAAGAAVHRALETWDLAAAVTGELERQRRLLPAYLAARLEPDLVPGALARGEEILARLARGTLLPRLRALAPHILGREVAALLPPGEVAGGPLAAVSGAIDLLLRDPADGRLVVVDYKTDLLEDPLEIAHRAAAYGAQGKVYLEAVRDALEPNLPPRFELWFLWADRIVVPQVAGPSGQST